MPDFSGARAFAMDGMITVADDSPLHRARAISGLIDEETLVSERLGRLTDRVAAVLLEANLFSIRVPQADGGAQRHKRRICSKQRRKSPAPTGPPAGAWGSATPSTHSSIRAPPPKARQEVFGNGPVACLATLLPKATSVEEQGGSASRGASAGGRAVHSQAG